MENNPPRELQPILDSSSSITDKFRVQFSRKKGTDEITARFFLRTGRDVSVLVKEGNGS